MNRNYYLIKRKHAYNVNSNIKFHSFRITLVGILKTSIKNTNVTAQRKSLRTNKSMAADCYVKQTLVRLFRKRKWPLPFMHF
jgi:hypothetical protein